MVVNFEILGLDFSALSWMHRFFSRAVRSLKNKRCVPLTTGKIVTFIPTTGLNIPQRQLAYQKFYLG